MVFLGEEKKDDLPVIHFNIVTSTSCEIASLILINLTPYNWRTIGGQLADNLRTTYRFTHDIVIAWKF